MTCHLNKNGEIAVRRVLAQRLPLAHRAPLKFPGLVISKRPDIVGS